MGEAVLLHHELLTTPGVAAARVVVFLHGILGTGANLRSHARRLLSSLPDTAALLLDLRAHGQSQGAEGEDTVAGAAADVVETLAHVGLPPHAVVGHSFGGKVALALTPLLPELGHVLTLDSAPGARPDARGSEATVRVLRLLEALRGPWSSREDFVREVVAHGESTMLASWLGMNLVRGEAGFVFTLTLSRIGALLDDYFHVDLWPVVERAAASRRGPRLHLVIGTRSQVYEHADRVRAQQLESESAGFVTVDLLDAGHWVHVEAPQGVAEVLQRRLQPGA